MSRRYRKKSEDGVFDMLVDVASYLPWWITLPIAAVLFFVVPFGESTGVLFEQPADLSNAAVAMMMGAIFKYLVPAALVIGAIIHIGKSLKSFLLSKSVSKNGARNTIANLDWRDFEFLLAEWFKNQGYAVEQTGGHGADGGIDIKLHKDGELYLVQCKHYKAWKVSVSIVRELFGVMVAEHAEGGFVVTSGEFTHEAKIFAEGKNIVLLDGEKLAGILDQSNVALEPEEEISASSSEGVCPRCGSALVRRNSKRGPFIGCSAYPKCHYTASLE